MFSLPILQKNGTSQVGLSSVRVGLQIPEIFENTSPRLLLFGWLPPKGETPTRSQRWVEWLMGWIPPGSPESTPIFYTRCICKTTCAHTQIYTNIHMSLYKHANIFAFLNAKMQIITITHTNALPWRLYDAYHLVPKPEKETIGSWVICWQKTLHGFQLMCSLHGWFLMAFAGFTFGGNLAFLSVSRGEWLEAPRISQVN